MACLCFSLTGFRSSSALRRSRLLASAVLRRFVRHAAESHHAFQCAGTSVNLCCLLVEPRSWKPFKLPTIARSLPGARFDDGFLLLFCASGNVIAFHVHLRNWRSDPFLHCHSDSARAERCRRRRRRCQQWRHRCCRHWRGRRRCTYGCLGSNLLLLKKRGAHADLASALDALEGG